MLIAFSGRPRSGKNTAAERMAKLIEAKYPEMYVEFHSFAAPLKKSAAAALGLTLDELEEMKLNPRAVIQIHLPNRKVLLTGRKYLENYGTEAHRDVFGEDFWLESLPENINEAATLVTDCRFPNEAERIKAMGGTVIEIVSGSKSNGHISDEPLPRDLVDWYVNNHERDDNFEYLDRGLNAVLNTIKLGE